MRSAPKRTRFMQAEAPHVGLGPTSQESQSRSIQIARPQGLPACCLDMASQDLVCNGQCLACGSAKAPVQSVLSARLDVQPTQRWMGSRCRRGRSSREWCLLPSLLWSFPLRPRSRGSRGGGANPNPSHDGRQGRAGQGRARGRPRPTAGLDSTLARRVAPRGTGAVLGAACRGRLTPRQVPACA